MWSPEPKDYDDQHLRLPYRLVAENVTTLDEVVGVLAALQIRCDEEAAERFRENGVGHLLMKDGSA